MIFWLEWQQKVFLTRRSLVSCLREWEKLELRRKGVSVTAGIPVVQLDALFFKRWQQRPPSLNFSVHRFTCIFLVFFFLFFFFRPDLSSWLWNSTGVFWSVLVQGYFITYSDVIEFKWQGLSPFTAIVSSRNTLRYLRLLITLQHWMTNYNG